MNTSELQVLLNREEFNPGVYDLSGGHLSERLTIAHQAPVWCVYYSERGLETGKRTFATESEACDYFLAKMRKLPGTKIKR